VEAAALGSRCLLDDADDLDDDHDMEGEEAKQGEDVPQGPPRDVKLDEARDCRYEETPPLTPEFKPGSNSPMGQDWALSLDYDPYRATSLKKPHSCAVCAASYDTLLDAQLCRKSHGSWERPLSNDSTLKRDLSPKAEMAQEKDMLEKARQHREAKVAEGAKMAAEIVEKASKADVMEMMAGREAAEFYSIREASTSPASSRSTGSQPPNLNKILPASEVDISRGGKKPPADDCREVLSPPTSPGVTTSPRGRRGEVKRASQKRTFF